MRGPAHGGDLAPVDAAVADRDAVDAERLRDDDEILPVGRQHALAGQPRHAGEPAALLVDGGADLDRPLERHAGPADRLGREDGGSEAPLHVRAPAPVDAVAAHRAAERLHRPAVAGRHDVEVAVQVHAGPRVPPAANADHVDARVVGPVLGKPVGRVELCLEAEPAERVADAAGARFVGLAGRIDGRDGDEVGGERDQLAGEGVDRLEEPIEITGHRESRRRLPQGRRTLGYHPGAGRSYRLRQGPTVTPHLTIPLIYATALLPEFDRQHHRRTLSRVARTRSSVSGGNSRSGTETRRPFRFSSRIGVAAGSISMMPSRSRISIGRPPDSPRASRIDFGMTTRPAASMVICTARDYHRAPDAVRPAAGGRP